MGVFELVLKLRKTVLLVGVLILAFAAALYVAAGMGGQISVSVSMGGWLLAPPDPPHRAQPVMTQEQEADEERYHRPSKAPALENTYEYAESGTPATFELPEQVVDAYYGVLREASNLAGYSGGCGTVGYSDLPYPIAYSYLSKAYQKRLPYKVFLNSFAGVGHTTELKRYAAYAPPGTPDTRRYYMVEIETIEGEKQNDPQENPVHFSYHYGIVAVEKEGEREGESENWKIADIAYIPEDFLCAPYHSWFYDASAVAGIVYQENLKLFDMVDSVTREGDFTEVEGSGAGGQYKLQFVRLTNGYDILLHEYKRENGSWAETSLLPPDWQYLKLTPDRAAKATGR